MDTVMKVPADAIKGVQNFAIDFGGTFLKLAYMKKNDIHPEDYTLVHQRCFPREEFQEAIDFIKKECEIPDSKNEELPQYTLTGYGTHQFHKILKEQLNIRVTISWEMSCFGDALKLLIENFSNEELFLPPVFEGDDTLTELANNIQKMTEDFGVVKEKTPDEEENSESGAKLPCIMGMLGSSFGFNKIQADGTQVQGVVSNSGGRMFLGLGSLLTGTKTYEELMELAEKGDGRNIHCYSNQLMQSDTQDESDNPYGKMGNVDMLCFAFGWCAGKHISEFRREDLARALLVDICRDIVHHSMAMVEKLKASNVILVGGFVHAPLTRRLIEEEFSKKAFIMAKMHNKIAPTLRVMKAGSHLGALGAMLQSKPKPEVQQEAAAEKDIFKH